MLQALLRVLSIFAIAASLWAARPGDFRVIGPGGGGAMFNPTVSPHDKNTVLVSCDMTGAYITHDGGQSWRMFNLRGTVRFFAFDPIDPKTMYAKVTGLWRSTDSGETWRSFIQARRRFAAFAWIPIMRTKRSSPTPIRWAISLLWRLIRRIRKHSMRRRHRTGKPRCLHRGISERRGAVKRACRKLLAIFGLIRDLRGNPARYISPAQIRLPYGKTANSSTSPRLPRLPRFRWVSVLSRCSMPVQPKAHSFRAMAARVGRSARCREPALEYERWQPARFILKRRISPTIIWISMAIAWMGVAKTSDAGRTWRTRMEGR